MLQFRPSEYHQPSFSSPHTVTVAKAFPSTEVAILLQTSPIFREKIGNYDNKKGRRSANSNGLDVIVWSTMRGGTNGSLATGRRLPEVLIVNPSPVPAEGR